MENKNLPLILILVIVLILGYVFFSPKKVTAPIQQAISTQVNEYQIEGDKDSLVSFSIKPGQEVSGKLHTTGEISGGYFFEGNLPISILDANKNPTSYGPGHGQSTSDWMTALPVSFEANFDFTTIPSGSYFIKITQDDPSGGESGYPIKSVLIPISVKNTTQTNSSNNTSFTGIITALDNGCWSDGICKIEIDNNIWITYNIGRNLNHEPLGSVEGDLKIGSKVEILAKYIDKNNYTLVGDEKYYIKIIK